ncbi:glycosyltransferase family 39 protein [Frigidibacter albus]
MRPDLRGVWLGPALVALTAITALRIAALALTPMDLFVDEAQYWLWGQDLAFGYYSKPPLIAWLIRAVTELAGSDAPFWVRLPGPLLHMATALLLGAIAARLWSPRAALFTALAYATLPMVGVASLLISTDSVMFPFLAAALLLWLQTAERGRPATAIAAGVCLGLALLAKYAAIYFLIGAVIAPLLSPAARVRPGLALLALLAFAATIAPNIWWNVANGFSTLEHTLDNADWVRDPAARVSLSPAEAGVFLGEQLAVFGPVLFGGLVALTLSTLRRRTGAPVPLLLAFTLPALAVVTAQAFLSGAYANWAASAYLAGTVAVVPWLLARARTWLAISFALNGALCLALPFAAIFADRLSLGNPDHLLLSRYIGQAELSRQIIAEAEAEGLHTIVARNRDVLADLFYTGRDAGLSYRAEPQPGRPQHHYALKFPLDPGQPGDVLLVSLGDAPDCTPAAPLQTITPARGNWQGKTITLWRVPAACWG